MDELLPASMDSQGFCQLFKERVPTLQQLTSSKIARILWHNVFFGGHSDETENELGDYLKWEYREKVEQSCQFLRDYIPHHLIPQLLKHSIVKVHWELNDWISCNKGSTLPDNQMRIFRDHLKCLVWRFNGEIDHTQTARKMLSLDSLSQIDKFDIMCRYCLEDEFEKFTPNEELEGVLAKVISHRRPRLAFYWICKLKKDLPGMRFGVNFESLESFMVTKMEREERYAILYFWNRLSEQDQVNKAVLLLQNWTLVKHLQKPLLSKMNEFQLNHILSVIPVTILASFWKSYTLKEPDTMFSIWTRIKYLISGEQFGEVLRGVLLSTGSFSKGRIPLIIKLWYTACDHHKNFILEQDKNDIRERYFSFSSLPVSEMLQFIHAVLSYSSPSYRKEFIMEQGIKLMVAYHYQVMHLFLNNLPANYEIIYSEADRVIRLCLPDDSDVLEFKKKLIKSSNAVNICKTQFSWGYFKKLNKFVEFYAPDISTIGNFKKLILDSSKFKTKHIFRDGNWTEVEKFIDDAYPDPVLAENMKRQLILTSGICGLFDSMDADSFRSMVNITTRVLTDDEMVKMKDLVLVLFGYKHMDWYFWKSFDETFWQEFASFCLDGGEKIDEYKSKIQIDYVFVEKFNSMVSQYIREKNFFRNIVSVMDNYLNWYFADPEEVKKFKLRKVFGYYDWAIIENYVDKPSDIKNVKTLFVWFLDNDEEQISKFKMEFADKKVSQFV